MIPRLSANYVYKKESVRSVTKGYLQPQTECFFMIIQEVIQITFGKLILKMSGETIEHVRSGCPNQSENEYLFRHNQVAIVKVYLSKNHHR